MEIIQPFVFLSVHNQLAKENVMNMNQIHTYKEERTDCPFYRVFLWAVQDPIVHFFKDRQFGSRQLALDPNCLKSITKYVGVFQYF